MRFESTSIFAQIILVVLGFCCQAFTEKNNMSDIEISTGNENALVILMHGLGDTPDGWSQMAKQFKPSLPHIKWILPCAPQNNVSVNNGMKMTSWMDILEIPIATTSPDNGVDIDESIAIVNKIINTEIEKGVVKPGRIVVGGFSQGAALAIASSLRFDKKLGGFFALSGWCLPKQNIKDISKTSINNNVPVFIGHGTSDSVVLYENAVQSNKYFEDAGFKDVTFKKYNGMGHSSCNEETRDLLKWFARVLPSQ
jgi:predicted esterase